MQAYVALLRGINVGGHTVKMTELKQHFENYGFVDVRTYIASGNILFKSNETDVAQLEFIIEDYLLSIYGFVIAIMIRTAEEMQNVVADSPFNVKTTADKQYVTFLKSEPPSSTVSQITENLDSGERVYLHGREIYFTIPAESIFSNNWLEKAVKKACTTRNWNTTKKLAELIKAD